MWVKGTVIHIDILNVTHVTIENILVVVVSYLHHPVAHVGACSVS